MQTYRIVLDELVALKQTLMQQRVSGSVHSLTDIFLTRFDHVNEEALYAITHNDVNGTRKQLEQALNLPMMLEDLQAATASYLHVKQRFLVMNVASVAWPLANQMQEAASKILQLSSKQDLANYATLIAELSALTTVIEMLASNTSIEAHPYTMKMTEKTVKALSIELKNQRVALKPYV